MLVQPPPPQVVYVAAPPPRPSRRLPMITIIVLALLVALLGGFLVARELTAPAPVSLEPVATAGADPWMPSVGTDALDVRPVANTSGRHTGTTPGLYGGSGSDAVCDRGQLSRFLGQHPDRAAAWASVLGLTSSSAADISRYVDGLTPVVLRSDTFVTNHGWRNGSVTSYSSVLQAGTAVLVNSYGSPVTRCFCGNPLTAPLSFSSVSYYGPRWTSFSTTSITLIQQSTTVVNNYTLVDVHSGRGQERPVGTEGQDDTEVTLPPAVTDGLPGTTDPTVGAGGGTGVGGGTESGATVPGTDGEGRPGLPGVNGRSVDPSLTEGTPSSSTAPTTTTTTTEASDPPSVLRASSDCQLGVSISFTSSGPGSGRYTAEDESGTWTRSGDTLTLSPETDSSATTPTSTTTSTAGTPSSITLTFADGEWTATSPSGCTLSETP